MVRRKMDEKGVSPVIGVMLMVAITVILAAVVASFVFGMGQSVQRTYIVSFTMTNTSSGLVITYHGGPDAAYVSKCTVYYNDTSGSEKSANVDTSHVGAVTTISGGAKSGTVATIVCRFQDGTEQVVLTYNVP